jgi:hypothetical protein
MRKELDYVCIIYNRDGRQLRPSMRNEAPAHNKVHFLTFPYIPLLYLLGTFKEG